MRTFIDRHAGLFAAFSLTLCAFSLLLLAGCAPQVTVGREVTAHVANGGEGLAGLDRVVITLEDAALHPQGRPRDDGWVDLKLTTPTFELGTEAVLVAKGDIPPGRYDRVRVEVAEVYGEQGGQRVAVRNIVEPIYLAFPLRSSPADLHFELIVLPLRNADLPEKWAIYTKSIAVR